MPLFETTGCPKAIYCIVAPELLTAFVTDVSILKPLETKSILLSPGGTLSAALACGCSSGG